MATLWDIVMLPSTMAHSRTCPNSDRSFVERRVAR